MKSVILGLLGLQNGVMPDLRDMTQLKRKREVEEETEKSESSLEEECKRFRSQYVSPQVTLFDKLFADYICTDLPVRNQNILLQAYQSAMWGKWVQGQHTNQAIKVKI